MTRVEINGRTFLLNVQELKKARQAGATIIFVL